MWKDEREIEFLLPIFRFVFALFSNTYHDDKCRFIGFHAGFAIQRILPDYNSTFFPLKAFPGRIMM